MKKFLCVILAMFMVFALAGCGSTEPEQEQEQEDNTPKVITLYTPAAQDYLDVLLPAFEEETGIHVEAIRGASGEVYARIQAEAENPQADVAWFPCNYILQDTSYFDQYVSPNNGLYDEKFQNETGYTTRINYTVPVVIYNTEMYTKEIKGYADLLDEELFGKIAFGNASSSSSAYDQLECMLYDMGTGSTFEERVMSDSAWEYVEKFLKQLDGSIVDSSSVTYNGVIDGEFVVGMSWDTPAAEFLYNKSTNIGVCYMQEGVIVSDSCVSLIHNAPNAEAAKLFIDWISSEKGQSLMGTGTIGCNPLLPTAQVGDWKVGITEFDAVTRTADQKATMKEQILAKFNDLYLQIFE